MPKKKLENTARNDAFVSDFKTRLKELRALTGISQSKLAAAVGLCNDSKIRYYESGRTINPGIDILVRFADFFDVSVDYLIGRTDNPQRL